VLSLHRQFSDLGVYERHALDSTRLDPQATADVVLRGLAEQAYLLRARSDRDGLDWRAT
jgi:hypothetical protein